MRPVSVWAEARMDGDARSLAAALVNAVVLDRHSLSAALDAMRRDTADPRRRAATQDLAYGVLRQYGRLNHILNALLARPLAPPGLAGPLLVALFELGRANAPAYAVVDAAVREAGRMAPRAKGLVNAVLRNYLRRRAALDAAAAADPTGRWNFPLWWIEHLQAAYPERWSELLDAANTPPPMSLRIQRRRIGAAAYRARLTSAGIPFLEHGEWALTLERPLAVENIPGFGEGEVSVQDLGAQQAAGLLAPQPGERVLDACAAPGGKSAHLLELADIELVALDVDGARLARVEAGLARLGLKATLGLADAGRPADWWDGRPFDRILLDAPCTASGVVRRHPDGKWLKRPEDITRLAAEQARLLDALWPLLAPGGTLLYATCSLFPEENGLQAESFLARHSDARRELVGAFAGLDWVEEGQLLPTREHDGFFYARFVKT